MPYLVGSGEPHSLKDVLERNCVWELCNAPCTFSTWKVKVAQNEAGQRCGRKTPVSNSSKIHLSFGRGALLWFFPGTTTIKLEYVKSDSETIKKPDDS